MNVRYNLHYVRRRTPDMSEIFSFTAAFIVVQIFKIIMFKKDKDYSGYDERQELIRGRAFRYGFLTLAFSLAAVVLWEECVGALPIEFSLLMMACLMVGCLVVILYDIWKDAYWGIRQASGSNAAIVLMVAVMVMQYLGFQRHANAGDVIVHGVLTWDGGMYIGKNLLIVRFAPTEARGSKQKNFFISKLSEKL